MTVGADAVAGYAEHVDADAGVARDDGAAAGADNVADGRAVEATLATTDCPPRRDYRLRPWIGKKQRLLNSASGWVERSDRLSPRSVECSSPTSYSLLDNWSRYRWVKRFLRTVR